MQRWNLVSSRYHRILETFPAVPDLTIARIRVISGREALCCDLVAVAAGGVFKLIWGESDEFRIRYPKDP